MKTLQFLVGPLAAICDPYLNIFRGIIPPLGRHRKMTEEEKIRNKSDVVDGG